MKTINDFGSFLHSKKARATLAVYLSDPFAYLEGAVFVPSPSWDSILLIGEYPDAEDTLLTWNDLIDKEFNPQTMVILDFCNRTGDPHRVVISEHQSDKMSVNRYLTVCYTLY